MNSLAATLLDQYSLPQTLGFGELLAPIMYRADYGDGRWGEGGIAPYGDVPVSPASTAVQFGQQAFEGLKAYKHGGQVPTLFRPDRNFQRFAQSARRLAMAPVPAGQFAAGLSGLTGLLESFIPGDSGQSLYLRPTLFGLDAHFAVRNSERFAFFVLASPSDAYYAEPMRVMIEREACRAAVGGTGNCKVGGNYGAAMQANVAAAAHGFNLPLWLDPETRSNIEELSAMNFMAVVDGQLHTPRLSGSILEGVTRDSLLRLAEHLGMETAEVTMNVDQLKRDIASGRCTEAFACGTAAIVCPIAAIGERDGATLELSEVDKVAAQLKQSLLDIQEGRAADPFGWTVPACDESELTMFLRRKTTATSF